MKTILATSKAIRAWISYTATVKSFFILWTCGQFRHRITLSMGAENGVTHGQVLSETLKLAAYPVVWKLLSPSLLEFC